MSSLPVDVEFGKPLRFFVGACEDFGEGGTATVVVSGRLREETVSSDDYTIDAIIADNSIGASSAVVHVSSIAKIPG